MIFNIHIRHIITLCISSFKNNCLLFIFIIFRFPTLSFIIYNTGWSGDLSQNLEYDVPKVDANYCFIYCIFFHCQFVEHTKTFGNISTIQKFQKFRKRYKNCCLGERSLVWKYEWADEFNKNILLPIYFNLSSFR